MSFGIANVDGAAALVRDGRYVPLSHWNETRGVAALLADWDNVQPRLEGWANDAPAWEAAADFESARVELPYRPGQVFCTGANYKKHVVGLIMGDPSMRTEEHEAMDAAERQAKVEAMMEQRAKALPFCFIKLPSCAIGPRDTVLLPPNVEKPDWELELGVVIGRRAHRVSAAEAMDYVAGYAVVNDVTAREHIFRRDGSAIGADWLSGKCFPTFLPFGPMIVPRDQVPDPSALTITLSVNGKVYQNESTADMMASIERQIEYLSHRVILEPGDLICTGSPYGNGSAFGVFLKPGDVMEGTITGLGTQRNPCAADG
ncbi:2-keto-4-pentenoate hydratase/2-oxohepta-3-ene-1,7-dioic acid hydratase in catechol pathway [Altererythrobacter atlanticus]|uniref:Ureidoglycolate lyase n=1 Tax=Croceibacterium atlanticum TaxID=1267766 RepID=A0A0F7KVV4_9SPHN|nr:fumarylacetoacetate hydrolase family protein [Croceibacterium atlanticum]AKH42885.1 Ureidoglycolate lyase [Croceibacterium atlanticum]MBB5731665.1 2-keto-4-pentenoate hydratase/2-oxohepta-3-ene-1,7-dioic acid hydratase in catechol pathway [Croceibacterium atlanticum]